MTGAFIEIKEQATWDRLVAANQHGHLLQSWGWGELKSRFGWRPLRLAATAPDNTVALAQVLIRRKFGLNILYIPRGPLWCGDEYLDTLLLRGLIRLARRSRAAFLRLEPNLLQCHPFVPELHTRLLLHSFEPADPLQPRTSIHLDLHPTPDQLLAGMSKGHRADIKRAAKKGVEIHVGRSPADLETFYALMQATSQRAGFAIHSQAYYQAAWEIFAGLRADGAARLLLAKQQGRAVAAFLVFGWGHDAYYMYSASSPDGLRSGANHLLQWEALQWAKQHGCTRYDFWGIPDAIGEAVLAEDPTQRKRLEEKGQSHPLAGVYRFKKGFGGRVVRYVPAYDYILIRPIYRLWQRRRGE